MNTEVVIQIPATTANLGPGFDSLGIALNLHNRLILKTKSAASVPEMISEAAKVFFQVANQQPFGFSYHIEGEVPRSRGLGSSVTVRLGILMGLNHLTNQPLSINSLYQVCAELERHPDNAAAATFGGFTIARRDWSYQKFDVSTDLHFLLLVPSFEVSTTAAREKMPSSVPLRDASLSVANAAWISAAFASRNYAALRGSFEDALHQPYRIPMVPFLEDVIRKAEAAGALGGWLSGSGSTVACLTAEDPERVAYAMQKVAPPNSLVLQTVADNRGACRLS